MRYKKKILAFRMSLVNKYFDFIDLIYKLLIATAKYFCIGLFSILYFCLSYGNQLI